MKKRILCVIDVQNDFIDGSLGTPEAQAIIPNVEKKIDEYITNGNPIIFTRDTHFLNYSKTQEGKKLPIHHCIKDTHGWQIGIKTTPGSYEIINKLSVGYYDWKSFLNKFINTYFIDDEDLIIELIGLDTDICVISNAIIIKAAYPETNIVVDASCCAGSTPEKHKAALEVMKSCQIDVIGE
jgi:nicotinamidase-related amidase|uniref:Isochorismatase family n=1 Tax=virus sp. ctmTa7 TaxID=2828255 RepID=A0A8S5RBU8_9VIRU|nr:MAG TPA: Isochorismatase family [virus sp. ctmTa7]